MYIYLYTYILYNLTLSYFFSNHFVDVGNYLFLSLINIKVRMYSEILNQQNH